LNCLEQLRGHLEKIQQKDQFYYLLNTLRSIDFPAYIHSINTALYFSEFTHQQAIFIQNKNLIINTLLLHNIGTVCTNQDSNQNDYSYTILKNYYSDFNVLPEILKGKQKLDHCNNILHPELQPEIDVCNIVLWFDELTCFTKHPIPIEQALQKIKKQKAIQNLYLIDMFMQWAIQQKQWITKRIDECRYIYE